MEKAISPYQPPNNLGELIQEVCLHPVWFVGLYNFDLATGYISGYYYASCRFQPENFLQYELRDFSYWLAEKFHYNHNLTLRGVRTVFPDDETAFAQLPLLYVEFVNKKRTKGETAA